MRKVKKRRSQWFNRWLSLRGRFILVKFILENIPIYWLSMVRIPTSILDIIRRRISTCLWLGQKVKESFHLLTWDRLAIPKDYGGWNFKNIYYFGKALVAKRLWRGLFSRSMQSDVIK